MFRSFWRSGGMSVTENIHRVGCIARWMKIQRVVHCNSNRKETNARLSPETSWTRRRSSTPHCIDGLFGKTMRHWLLSKLNAPGETYTSCHGTLYTFESHNSLSLSFAFSFTLSSSLSVFPRTRLENSACARARHLWDLIEFFSHESVRARAAEMFPPNESVEILHSFETNSAPLSIFAF